MNIKIQLYESGSIKHITLSPFGLLKIYNNSNNENCTDSVYVQKRFAELLSSAIAEYMDIQYAVKTNQIDTRKC